MLSRAGPGCIIKYARIEIQVHGERSRPVVVMHLHANRMHRVPMAGMNPL